MTGEELAVYFDNPARDALGFHHVEGCLRLGRDGVELRFSEKARAFRKPPPRIAAFAWDEVGRVDYEDRWLRPKALTLQVRTPEKLQDFPGAAAGKVTLLVTRESRREAAKAPALADFKRSEAILEDSAARWQEQRGEFQSGL